jgi:hypothetical protein
VVGQSRDAWLTAVHQAGGHHPGSHLTVLLAFGSSAWALDDDRTTAVPTKSLITIKFVRNLVRFLMAGPPAASRRPGQSRILALRVRYVPIRFAVRAGAKRGQFFEHL